MPRVKIKTVQDLPLIDHTVGEEADPHRREETGKTVVGRPEGSGLNNSLESSVAI